MKQLLFLLDRSTKKTTEPFDSNALKGEITIALPAFFRKSHKKYPLLILLDGVTCSIRFMEHYLMAPIGMIYLK
jgi:hypothetical protein